MLNILSVFRLKFCLISLGIVVSTFVGLAYRLRYSGKHISWRCTLLNHDCPNQDFFNLNFFYTQDQRFNEIKRIFADQFKKGHHKGAQITVLRGDEVLVHSYGGDSGLMPFQLQKNMEHKGEISSKCDKNSLFRIFSSGKMFEVLAIAKLMDMRLKNAKNNENSNPKTMNFDLDTKISKFWPEFGQNGKENITISNLLKHEAGLSWFDPQVPFCVLEMVSPCPNASTYFIPSPEEFFKPKSWKQIQKDRKTVKKVIEIQKPHWNPQTLTSGYHVFTRGAIVDQIVQILDPKSRSLERLVKEEILDKINEAPGRPENFPRVEAFAGELMLEQLYGKEFMNEQRSNKKKPKIEIFNAEIEESFQENDEKIPIYHRDKKVQLIDQNLQKIDKFQKLTKLNDRSSSLSNFHKENSFRFNSAFKSIKAKENSNFVPNQEKLHKSIAKNNKENDISLKNSNMNKPKNEISQNPSIYQRLKPFFGIPTHYYIFNYLPDVFLPHYLTFKRFEAVSKQRYFIFHIIREHLPFKLNLNFSFSFPDLSFYIPLPFFTRKSKSDSKDCTTRFKTQKEKTENCYPEEKISNLSWEKGVSSISMELMNSWPGIFLIGGSSYNWYSNSYSLAIIASMWLEFPEKALNGNGKIFGTEIISKEVLKKFLQIEPAKLLPSNNFDIVTGDNITMTKGGIGHFIEEDQKFSDDKWFEEGHQNKFLQILERKMRNNENFDLSTYNSDRRKKISFSGWPGFGGTAFVVDHSRNLSIGYVRNGHCASWFDEEFNEILRKVAKILDEEEVKK